MSQQPQSYSNHGKMVPGYHYVGTAVLLVALGWSSWRLYQAPSVDSVVGFLSVVGLIVVFWYARVFALGVQDRVIRLEERLRMERLFDGELRGRIGEFTTEQLIALRFASDEELTALARRVLDEGIEDRKIIKLAVKNWRADHQRI